MRNWETRVLTVVLNHAGSDSLWAVQNCKNCLSCVLSWSIQLFSTWKLFWSIQMFGLSQNWCSDGHDRSMNTQHGGLQKCPSQFQLIWTREGAVEGLLWILLSHCCVRSGPNTKPASCTLDWKFCLEKTRMKHCNWRIQHWNILVEKFKGTLTASQVSLGNPLIY